MTAFVLIFSLLAGSLSLAAGYGMVAHYSGMGALMGFMLLWPLASWRKWHWFPSLNFGMAALTAMIGVFFYQIPLAWMFVGVLGALLAWDLEAFTRRLALAAENDDLPRLERGHFFQLAQFTVLVVLLAVGTRLVPLQIPFGWVFWLVVLLALGLTRTVIWLRRQTGCRDRI